MIRDIPPKCPIHHVDKQYSFTKNKWYCIECIRARDERDSLGADSYDISEMEPF
jgi:hypothetical protein